MDNQNIAMFTRPLKHYTVVTQHIVENTKKYWDIIAIQKITQGKNKTKKPKGHEKKRPT